jgi:predicted signal transduction protein with EAL and GGDEF domain
MEASVLKTKISFIVYLSLAIIAGLVIAWIDSRPSWDDAGITVMMVLISALVLGFLASHKPWLIAILVSIWIPIFGIILSHNFGGFIALVPGFIGAYLGYFIKRQFLGTYK